jgi:hypothetical protein
MCAFLRRDLDTLSDTWRNGGARGVMGSIVIVLWGNPMPPELSHGRAFR